MLQYIESKIYICEDCFYNDMRTPDLAIVETDSSEAKCRFCEWKELAKDENLVKQYPHLKIWV